MSGKRKRENVNWLPETVIAPQSGCCAPQDEPDSAPIRFTQQPRGKALQQRPTHPAHPGQKALPSARAKLVPLR